MIRATAVQALRDWTWCEERVFDSDQTPLAEAINSDKAQPYCVVYTDDDTIESTDGNEVYKGLKRSLSLVLEIGVASAVKGKDNVTITFARTDDGMEFACDVIQAQCMAALIGAPKSKWGNLFKEMVTLRRVPSRRGGQAERGIRYAARRVPLVLQPLQDLLPGVPLREPHFARDFIAMGEASDQVSINNMAKVLRQLFLDNPVPVPDWREAQSYLGLSTKQAQMAMVPGLPLPYPEIEEPPLDYSDTNEFPPAMGRLVLPDGDVQ
jgi:hypothetical protein